MPMLQYLGANLDNLVPAGSGAQVGRFGGECSPGTLRYGPLVRPRGIGASIHPNIAARSFSSSGKQRHSGRYAAAVRTAAFF
jgi:hypothetical protein